ncbi:MAG TPA: DNA polymerase III subunit delta [Caldithrix abyssi]|uniref:DNA polymerase III subunit delta n=1 Tax=Caldithrix abyssi TaxID=187145 RepID=A0A7V5VE74_CALAY|nr:DNA polymerase III subunit delta [Caldithrix abyssi]
MAGITPARMLALIQKNELEAAYLLSGKEKFFQDQIISALDKKLFPDPGARSLNRIVMQGSETTFPEIVSACMGYPMLSDKKLVIVKDAGRVSGADVQLLLNYLEAPQAATLLLLIADTDKSAALSKIASKTGRVECKPVTEWKIQEWVISRVREREREFSAEALAAFSDYVGTNLLMIENELDKINNYKPQGKIVLDDIIAATGMSREYNVFALQDALAARDLKKSLRIATALLENGENINKLLVILFGYFRKLSMYAVLRATAETQSYTSALGVREFQLKKMNDALKKYNRAHLEKVLALIQETDWKSKSSSVKSLPLMQMICYNICRVS